MDVGGDEIERPRAAELLRLANTLAPLGGPSPVSITSIARVADDEPTFGTIGTLLSGMTWTCGETCEAPRS